MPSIFMMIKEKFKAQSLFVRDITERKRIESALKKSEKTLDEAQQLAHMGSWE